MNTEIVYKKIHKLFEQHQNDPHIEVEMRLGKFNGKLFDTNVGKDTFDKVYRALVKYQAWEKIYTTQEEVFYRDRDNIRMSIDQNTGDQKIVQKTSVHKEDFKKIKGVPYDVRVAFSKEIPTDIDDFGDMDRKRSKHRQSFVRKNLSIDLTMSTGDAIDMDAEDMTEYQVEFEIIAPPDVKSKNELLNIVQKVNDLLKVF